MQKIWSIIDIINWGTNYFKEKKVESPRLNIELLLCKVLNVERLYLYTNFDKPLKPEELTLMREFVKSRSNGEPLQYILGTVDFFGLTLEVDKNVLIPRPETEQLVEIITVRNKNGKNLRILEIGTGSGCIAISLAKHFPESEVFAVDISKEAIEIAKKNADKNEVKNVFFKVMDILSSQPQKKYDVIVSNPPYIPLLEYNELEKELFFEPKFALTDEQDGLQFYKRFAEIFPSLLNENGIFFLELGENTYKSIDSIFDNNLYKVELVNDFRKVERFVIGSL